MYQCYFSHTNQKHSVRSLHLLHCHPDVTLCDRWELVNSTMDKEALKPFDTCIHHGLDFTLSDETLIICMSFCMGLSIITILIPSLTKQINVVQIPIETTCTSFCRGLSIKTPSLTGQITVVENTKLQYTSLIAWYHPSPEGNICPTLVSGTV